MVNPLKKVIQIDGPSIFENMDCNGYWNNVNFYHNWKDLEKKSSLDKFAVRNPYRLYGKIFEA